MRKKQTGEFELVTKKGKEVKIRKITLNKLQGDGKRLGTAYRLKDGKTVYTVSEINEIKHAYRKGIEPQPGIDY